MMFLKSSLVHLAVIGCSWAASYADIRSLRMVPAKALDQTAVIRVPTLDARKVEMKLFENTDNVILVNETDSVLVHHTKLNSAARVGGLSYSLPSEIEVEDNTWFEFKSNNKTTILGPRLPLTPCLNSLNGDGGSLGGTFSKTFGRTASLDLPFGFDIDTVSLTVDYMTSVATSVQVSGDYSCTISANETGQLFIQPYFIEISDPQYRKVNIYDRRSWRNPTSRKPSRAEIEQWRPYKSKVRLVSFSSKPIFTCVTDPEYLSCDTGMTEEAFVFS